MENNGVISLGAGAGSQISRGHCIIFPEINLEDFKGTGFEQLLNVHLVHDSVERFLCHIISAIQKS